MFLVFIFNKALKLLIPLQSTMDTSNKNKLDAFSFNQDTFIKNLESKIQSKCEENPQWFTSKLWHLVCKTRILMQIVSLWQTMHFMTWFCPKSIGWLLLTLKNTLVWKVLWWGFQTFDCFLKFSNNTSCTIRSLVPTLDGASCFSLFTMLLLLHFATHPTSTQRPLCLASKLMKIFGVEDSMITIAKKLRGESNESESWVMMIWKGWQKADLWVMAMEANCKALVVA